MFLNAIADLSARKLLMEGQTAYQYGDAKNAVEKLSMAISRENEQIYPDTYLLSEIHNIRGEAYIAVRAVINALTDFTISIVYQETNENALNNLGVWYSLHAIAAPDFKKSLAYFDQALRLNPERKDILMNRAIVRIKSGNIMGYEDLKKLELEKYEAATIALMEYGE